MFRGLWKIMMAVLSIILLVGLITLGVKVLWLNEDRKGGEKIVEEELKFIDGSWFLKKRLLKLIEVPLHFSVEKEALEFSRPSFKIKMIDQKDLDEELAKRPPFLSLFVVEDMNKLPGELGNKRKDPSKPIRQGRYIPPLMEAELWQEEATIKEEIEPESLHKYGAYIAYTSFVLALNWTPTDQVLWIGYYYADNMKVGDYHIAQGGSTTVSLPVEWERPFVVFILNPSPGDGKVVNYEGVLRLFYFK